MEIKVTIEAPTIVEAINNLAAAIAGKNITSVQNEPIKQAVPEAMQTKTPDSKNEPSVTPSAAAVPLAEAPKYTVEQIMSAGATLMDAGKANELIALLHSFGVQAVMDLKPDQLGAFATKMRELGAKI